MNYVKSIETEESVQEGHQQIHCRSSNDIILKLWFMFTIYTLYANSKKEVLDGVIPSNH